jgi:hypothetical protein
MGVSLSILLTFPKAQRQNLVGIGIGYENNFIHETGLALQYWQDLFLNGFGELPCLSLFGIDGYDSTEHSTPPFWHLPVRKRLCFDGFEGQLPKNGARRKVGKLVKNRVSDNVAVSIIGASETFPEKVRSSAL